MAIEIITGRAGKPHINSEDVRAYQAYTAGDGRYVLHGGQCTMTSANTAHIAPGEILVDGTHVRVTGAGEDVQIDNGASSYKRVDIVALYYTVTGTGEDIVESVEFVCVKGTPADSDPEDPTMPSSAPILEGPQETYIPYARILIDGINPQTPELIVKQYAQPVSMGGTGANEASAGYDSLINRGTIASGSDWSSLDPGSYIVNASSWTGATHAPDCYSQNITGGNTPSGMLLCFPMGDVKEQIFIPTSNYDSKRRNTPPCYRYVSSANNGQWLILGPLRVYAGSDVRALNNQRSIYLAKVSDMKATLGIKSSADTTNILAIATSGDANASGDVMFNMDVATYQDELWYRIILSENRSGSVRTNYYFAYRDF